MKNSFYKIHLIKYLTNQFHKNKIQVLFLTYLLIVKHWSFNFLLFCKIIWTKIKFLTTSTEYTIYKDSYVY